MTQPITPSTAAPETDPDAVLVDFNRKNISCYHGHTCCKPSIHLEDENDLARSGCWTKKPEMAVPDIPRQNSGCNRRLSPRGGVVVVGDGTVKHARILTPAALEFLSALHRTFEKPRRDQLVQRDEICRSLSPVRTNISQKPPVPAKNGEGAHSTPASPPAAKEYEFNGPPDSQLLVPGLTSGAAAFVADFGHLHTSTWEHRMTGHGSLCDVVHGRMTIRTSGPPLILSQRETRLIVRPRSWDLDEEHILVDGRPMSASLVDFGLFFLHNASTLSAQGLGPTFDLPILDGCLGARLWNEVVHFAEFWLDVPGGSTKASVHIDTAFSLLGLEGVRWSMRDHLVSRTGLPPNNRTATALA